MWFSFKTNRKWALSSDTGGSMIATTSCIAGSGWVSLLPDPARGLFSQVFKKRKSSVPAAVFDALQKHDLDWQKFTWVFQP